MDGIRVWRGQGHIGDMDMEGTRVWKGHEYRRDKGI